MGTVALILDDDCFPDEPGILPSGRNRMEALYEYILEKSKNAILFDGRIQFPANEPPILGSPEQCAAAIVEQLATEETNGSIQREDDGKYGVVVSMDQEWFGDMEFGERFLTALFARPELNIGRVVVCSKHADETMRIQLVQKFEIPRIYVLDKAASPHSLIFKRLFDPLVVQ